jgi:hypothetical protein
LLAKKGIEGGEDIDNIPESMRQYLVMDTGEPMGGNFLGRAGLTPYGAGNMIIGDSGPQGKVGKSPFSRILNTSLIHPSHPPPLLSRATNRLLETDWSKCHGPDHLLLTGQGVHDVLYQQ